MNHSTIRHLVSPAQTRPGRCRPRPIRAESTARQGPRGVAIRRQACGSRCYFASKVFLLSGLLVFTLWCATDSTALAEERRAYSSALSDAGAQAGARPPRSPPFQSRRGGPRRPLSQRSGLRNGRGSVLSSSVLDGDPLARRPPSSRCIRARSRRNAGAKNRSRFTRRYFASGPTMLSA